MEVIINNKTPEQIEEVYENFKLRQQWDKTLSFYKICKSYPDNSNLIYYYVDVGFGITKRDFLERKFNLKNFPSQGDITLFSYSIKDNNYPEKKGFLRGTTYVSCTIIKKEGKHIKLQIFRQNDIQAQMIPNWILKVASTKTCETWLDNFVDALNKQCK